VLKVVENVNISICSFGGYNFLILWHIPGFDHFTLMVDLDVNRDPWLLILGDSVATNAVCIVID
jgi:hypothetical protein